ncbi:hypothetical protein G4V62_01465 [Bacillaceae bacterium SIJ1]|uniref:YphA family membrane protein n=1 Tax=Litoribacterium kuwaitense TaxID=1398745 RepID=UPI0013ED007A|nr:hypothetical protein [Litoribacterium kuwaitense]NGP43695.1 hypothetical protein [Litoribacterium kuwaitense]
MIKLWPSFGLLWLAWLVWLYMTFFAERSARRTRVAASVLSAIILSALEVPFFYENQVNAGFVFVGWLGFWHIFNNAGGSLLRRFFSMLTCAFCFAFFELFLLYDPVWTVLDKQWLVGSILFFLTLLLAKRTIDRLSYIAGGMVQGAFLVMLVLKKVNMSYMLGTMIQADILVVVLLLHGGWHFMKAGIRKLEAKVLQKQGWTGRV